MDRRRAYPACPVQGKAVLFVKEVPGFRGHPFPEMASDERVPGEVVRGPTGIRSLEESTPEGGAAPLLNGYTGPCIRRGVNPLTT